MGAGGALDLLPLRYKRKVYEIVRRATKDVSNSFFQGSRFLDKIFGTSLLSWRAAAASALMSITSIILACTVAYVTSDPLSQQQINPFRGEPTLSDMAVLAIFLISIIAFDYIAYTQTRIFVRALDGFRNATIAAILLVSDFAVSVCSFIFGYSIARLLSILLIVGFGQVNPDPYVRVFSPEMILEADSTISSNPIAKHDSPASREMLSSVIGEFEKQPDPAHAIRVLKFTDKLNGWSAYPRNGVYTAVETGCAAHASRIAVDDRGKEININYFRYSLGVLRALHPSEKLWNELTWKSLVEPIRMHQSRSEKCPYRYISASTRINLKAIATSVHLYDYLLSSSLATSQDLAVAGLDKFAYFESEDPFTEPYSFLRQSVATSELKILGVGGAATDSIPNAIGQLQASPSDGVRVPFAALAASCLTSSIVFLIYLLLVTTLWISKLMAQRFRLLGINSERHIFSKLSISLSFTILGLYLTNWIVGFVGWVLVSTALLTFST